MRAFLKIPVLTPTHGSCLFDALEKLNEVDSDTHIKTHLSKFTKNMLKKPYGTEK